MLPGGSLSCRATHGYAERCHPIDPIFLAVPMQRGDQSMTDFINVWIDQITLDGTMARNRSKWVGNGTAPPRSWPPLEAKMGQELALFVREHEGTFQAFQPGLGVVIAQRNRSFVIALGGGFILRAPSPAFGERA